MTLTNNSLPRKKRSLNKLADILARQIAEEFIRRAKAAKTKRKHKGASDEGCHIRTIFL